MTDGELEAVAREIAEAALRQIDYLTVVENMPDDASEGEMHAVYGLLGDAMVLL